jgi:ribosomal-protein-alanine N-acetyltransferase
MSLLNAAIGSQRLLLEPMTPAHAELLFGALSDPRIYEWISSSPPPSVEGLRERWAGASGLNWALRRRSDGAFVGKFDVELAGEVATNVGYLIFPAYWQQGYASEALRALVSHLAGHQVRELHACVTAGNTASERVLLNAGFARVRVIESNDTIRGVLHDDVEYIRRG